jgi:DNA-binding IclR family transcriptional regulator
MKAFTDVKMEWGVNELSRYVKIPVGSLHRHLGILKDENILKISPETGKYTIGNEFIRISTIVSSKAKIKDVALPFLENSANKLNQSIYLSIYHPKYRKLSFVESVLTSSALQYILEKGILQPIHIAASGKSILAYLNKYESETIIDEIGLDSKEIKVLKEELKTIRQEGYAMTSNERKEGALSIGAPIFNVSSTVIGSIIVVVPIINYKKSQKELLINEVKETAQLISHAIGFTSEK